MARKIKYALLFVCLVLQSMLFAQKNPTLSDLSVIAGYPLKHSDELLFENGQRSFGLRLTHYWQTTGKKEWQVRHNYPRLGFSSTWTKIGNLDTLGYAFTFAPEISLAFITKDRYEMRGVAAYGIAYLNKRFDYFDNPNNNAIGSHLNMNVMFKLSQAFRLTPNWAIKSSVAFTHFSNGARQLPNFGINIVNAQLGMEYRSVDFKVSEWNAERSFLEKNQRWGGEVYAGLGYREREESRGPSYPIYHLGASLVYNISTIQRAKLGYNWEYNQGVYVFGRHIILFDDLEQARYESQRRMIYYSHEMIFGPIGVSIWLGTYLNKKNSALLPGHIFNKTVVRYYLPIKRLGMVKPFVSFSMKSHKIRAEYISLQLGTYFGN